jgi:hypothetical protein
MLFTTKKIERYPTIFINYNDPAKQCNNYPIIEMSCINATDTPYFKFLGVIFDPNLNFKQHISHIITKVSKALYYLRNVKNFLNAKALKHIYYAIFHANIIYAIHVWSSVPVSSLKTLILKQKAAVRIINNARYNAHTEPLFKESRILPLLDLCRYFKIQFMQRYIQGYVPGSFTDTWTINRIRRQDEAQVELRNDNRYYIPFVRTNLMSLQPLISFPKTWEEFEDEEIKFIVTN